MKLLYISTPFYADCDFPLIRALQQKGLDVTFLVMVAPHSMHSTLINVEKQPKETKIFRCSEYPGFEMFDNYMDTSKVYVSNRTCSKILSCSWFMEMYNLRNFIKNGGFDLVHTDFYFSKLSNPVYKACKRWITTVHDPFQHTGESSTKESRIRQNAYKHTNAFVLLNETQRGEFCEFYHISPERVFTNRLGVYDNIRVFYKPEWSQKKHNILFFGRISPYKGIEYLCMAMKIVRQQVPDATLTIAGSGSFDFDIKSYSSSNYVELRNYFISLEELAELLYKCSVVVCPYTDATQSGVIMTAFSFGKPVVASNVGGLGETIEHNKNGLLVPPKNVDALAESLVRILESEPLSQSMSEYIAKDYFKGQKSWMAIAERYIETYKQVLKY